jgi:serine/alanine adding enzyme
METLFGRRMVDVTGDREVRVCSATAQDLGGWQRYVDSMPNAGCMHHSGWYGVLRDAYWVTPHFLMAHRGESIQGVLPLYYSRSPLTGAHVSSLEDGALASSPEATVALLAEARRLRDLLGANYLQIRGGAVDRASPIVQSTVHTFIDTVKPAKELWSAVKKKTRWGIRQAEKQNIVIERDAELESLQQFYRIYAEHMHELGTPVMGLDAFVAMRVHLGPARLRLYLVKYGGRIIGGMLCILNSECWTDYYAIVRPSDETEFANYLLYWNVIRDASASGVPRLDLGRSTPDSNTHLFKRKWGGCDVEVPYYFYPAAKARVRDMGLQDLKKRSKLPQRIWARLPGFLCNRIGPLLRKQLPFI